MPARGSADSGEPNARDWYPGSCADGHRARDGTSGAVGHAKPLQVLLDRDAQERVIDLAALETQDQIVAKALEPGDLEFHAA